MKKIARNSVLLVGVMFITGCNGLIVKPSENNETTYESSAYFDDSVKKATAILIQKTKNLEAANSKINKELADVKNELVPLKQSLSELKKQSQSVPKNNERSQSSTPQTEKPTKYDAIIKDFAYEGDSK